MLNCISFPSDVQIKRKFKIPSHTNIILGKNSSKEQRESRKKKRRTTLVQITPVLLRNLPLLLALTEIRSYCVEDRWDRNGQQNKKKYLPHLYVFLTLERNDIFI